MCVPEITANCLYSYLDGKFQEICKESWRNDYWEKTLLRDNIVPLCTSLRDCKRLVDIFSFKYFALKTNFQKSFNIVDLLGISAIELFYPKIIPSIYSNKKAFCGIGESLSEKQRKTLNAIPFETDNADADKIKQILFVLFPKYSLAQCQSVSRFHNEDSLKAAGSIADFDCFDVYFHLTTIN